jgi:hypothetical protein
MGVLCSACKNERPDKGHYFAIDSLVKEQVICLPALKASLKKESVLNNVVDTVSFTPVDTLLWSKELDAFLQLKEINKPINNGSYLVEDGLLDTQSNLTVKLFSSTGDQTVQWLKLYYYKSLSKLKKIEAQFNEENSLYKSSRMLCMEFQEYNNKTVLTSYSIIGGQKMFLSDSVGYSIKGKIKIK